MSCGCPSPSRRQPAYADDMESRAAQSGAVAGASETDNLRLALAAARIGEFEWDLAADRFVVSERMQALTGLPAGAHPAEGGLAGFRGAHPDDLPALRAAMLQVREGAERFDVDYRTTLGGRTLWMRAAGVAQKDAAGRPLRVAGFVQDVSAGKREDDARNALVAELDHRVKNVLATVQSLA